MTERRHAAAVASATFALVAPVAYVAQRLFEYARSPQVDPLLILRETHTAFYWRATTATWLAGIAAIVAYTLVRRASGGDGREIRALLRLTLPVAAIVVLFAWLYP